MMGCEKSDKVEESHASLIESEVSAAPWPFSGAAEIQYSVSSQLPNQGITDMKHSRTLSVKRDPALPNEVRIERRDKGKVTQIDRVRWEKGMVQWMGFEDKIHEGKPVVFRQPIPLFSPNFKGGERWGKPESLMVSVIEWVDVPLSSGKVKACKIKIDFNSPEQGFQRQIWYHPSWGIVFEDAKYYRGELISRHEQVTLLSALDQPSDETQSAEPEKH